MTFKKTITPNPWEEATWTAGDPVYRPGPFDCLIESAGIGDEVPIIPAISTTYLESIGALIDVSAIGSSMTLKWRLGNHINADKDVDIADEGKYRDLDIDDGETGSEKSAFIKGPDGTPPPQLPKYGQIIAIPSAEITNKHVYTEFMARYARR